ncbi:hypothetical protein Tco_0371576 [Tanacetum coccineum]
MIQPEIAESAEIAKSAEIAESAEITERTKDSRECRKFQNSINVTNYSHSGKNDVKEEKGTWVGLAQRRPCVENKSSLKSSVTRSSVQEGPDSSMTEVEMRLLIHLQLPDVPYHRKWPCIQRQTSSNAEGIGVFNSSHGDARLDRPAHTANESFRAYADRDLEYSPSKDPARFRFAHHTSFVKRHTGLSTKPGIRCVGRVDLPGPAGLGLASSPNRSSLPTPGTSPSVKSTGSGASHLSGIARFPTRLLGQTGFLYSRPDKSL